MLFAGFVNCLGWMQSCRRSDKVTIVVFDLVREKFRKMPKAPRSWSISQTLSCTLITSNCCHCSSYVRRSFMAPHLSFWWRFCLYFIIWSIWWVLRHWCWVWAKKIWCPCIRKRGGWSSLKVLETCPSGWRSTPGKCVYVNSVSRVRIPPSPPDLNNSKGYLHG